MSFYLRQNWSDPRLRFDASRNFNKTRLKLEDSQIKDVWTPDAFFRNEKGAGYHFVTQPNRLCYIYSSGYMWYVSKWVIFIIIIIIIAVRIIVIIVLIIITINIILIF